MLDMAFVCICGAIKNFEQIDLSFQQACMDEDQQRQPEVDQAFASTSSDSKKPRIKKSAYFSDEEELSD